MTAIRRLTSKIRVDTNPQGYYFASIDGEPDWGNTCGFTARDAQRAMEIYIEDNKGSIEVVLSGCDHRVIKKTGVVYD